MPGSSKYRHEARRQTPTTMFKLQKISCDKRVFPMLSLWILGTEKNTTQVLTNFILETDI